MVGSEAKKNITCTTLFKDFSLQKYTRPHSWRAACVPFWEKLKRFARPGETIARLLYVPPAALMLGIEADCEIKQDGANFETTRRHRSTPLNNKTPRVVKEKLGLIAITIGSTLAEYIFAISGAALFAKRKSPCPDHCFAALNTGRRWF
jgi:hypothetical protein